MLWNVRINTVKLFILPKVTYRFSTIFIKVPVVVFTEIEKHFQNSCETTKVLKQQKQSRAKKTKLEVTLPDFKTQYSYSYQDSMLPE